MKTVFFNKINFDICVCQRLKNSNKTEKQISFYLEVINALKFIYHLKRTGRLNLIGGRIFCRGRVRGHPLRLPFDGRSHGEELRVVEQVGRVPRHGRKQRKRRRSPQS